MKLLKTLAMIFAGLWLTFQIVGMLAAAGFIAFLIYLATHAH